MSNPLALVAAFSLASITAFAATTTALEKEVRDLSRSQQIAQANLLLTQEQKYNDKLKSYAPKAESSKETELAQKIKDELKLSDERIEEYKLLIKGEQKLYGIKFSAGDQWVIVKNATTIINNWHPAEKDAFKVIRVEDKFCFVDPKTGKAGTDGFVVGDNGNSISYAGIVHYRPGFQPKKEKKVEEAKSETENTLFGKRVKF